MSPSCCGSSTPIARTTLASRDTRPLPTLGPCAGTFQNLLSSVSWCGVGISGSVCCCFFQVRPEIFPRGHTHSAKTHGVSSIRGDGAAAVPRCPACSLDTCPPSLRLLPSQLVGEESLFCGSAAYFLGDEMFSSWIYSSLLISVSRTVLQCFRRLLRP